MGRLVIQPEGLHRRNHRTPPATRDEHRLLAHLTWQRSRKRMLKQIEYLLGIPRQQTRPLERRLCVTCLR